MQSHTYPVRMIVLVAAALVSLSGAVLAGDPVEPTSYDREACLMLRKAIMADDFREARRILCRIETSKVSDKTLRGAVSYSMRCCDLSIELGICRSQEPSLASVLKNIDYRACLRAVLDDGISGAPAKAKALFDEAVALRAGLERFQDDLKHLRRAYGR